MYLLVAVAAHTPSTSANRASTILQEVCANMDDSSVLPGDATLTKRDVLHNLPVR